MATAASHGIVKEKFVGNTTNVSAVPSGNVVGCGTKSVPNGQVSYGYDEGISGGGAVLEGPYNEQQVPIWVGLSCKLVSGISKATTCQDLISSIVPSSQDPSKYVVVEKWKKMERILDPSVKILKVWKAWGDQIEDVSFVLRSSPTADGYIDKKTSRKVHRKRSSNYHQQKEEDGEKEGHRDAMEQLIKLVITQGEAIQAQLKKLRQQEEQIDRYEEKMHKIRSSQLGENYVVDTYLKDDAAKPRRIKRREKSPCKRDAHGKHHHHHHHHHHYHRQKRNGGDDQLSPETCDHVEHVDEEVDTSTKPQSSNQTESSSTLPAAGLECEESPELTGESGESIKQKTELMESIFQLNVRLTQEEERLVKLGLKIRKLSDKQRKTEWEELALQDISQELEHLKQVTNEQSQEIEINERNLTALEQLLDDKHDHVAFLTHEIQLVDEECELLQQKVLELSSFSAGVDNSNHQQRHHHQETYELHEFHHPQYSNRTSSAVEEEITEAYPVHYAHEEIVQPSTVLLKHGETVNSSYNSIQGSPSSSSTVSYQHHQQNKQKAKQLQQELTCSSSCSNSSSLCVQMGQKQGSNSNGNGSNSSGNVGSSGNSATDQQDNDSNSDTGISSLHSSVDESPMYVLDTLV